MTRDEIIRIAEENGIVIIGEAMFRFAALVAAAERNECGRAASIALLGADKSLNDRVLNAIRSRGQRE